MGGDKTLSKSEKDHDLLGPGVYFWESDSLRALEWAKEKGYAEPFVIGAVIDLRNCLDLANREDLEILSDAYEDFLAAQRSSGFPLPENKNVKRDHHKDRLLRFLDCAVIRHLHEIYKDPSKNTQQLEPFDTVRGIFTEGGDLFEGSGFQRKTHVQIAVCNLDCIRGIFIPKPYPS